MRYRYYERKDPRTSSVIKRCEDVGIRIRTEVTNNVEYLYADGRRFSHISNAWILEESWNDKEEIARLTAELAKYRQGVEVEGIISTSGSIYLRTDAKNKLGMTEGQRVSVIVMPIEKEGK